MNRLYADEIFTPTEVTRKYQYQLEDSRDGEYELPVNARRGSDGLIEDETTGKGISLKDYVRFTTGDVDFHERYNESFSYNRSTDRGTGRYTVKIYMKKGHTDSDYLGYGYWSDRLRIGTDYGHIGVFAHGSDPYNQSNLISLTGTATYRAPVQPILVNASDLGFYNTGTTPQQRHNAWRNHILTYYDGIKDLSEIYGNVNLTVNFNDSDSLGSIEGSMNFRVTFFNDQWDNDGVTEANEFETRIIPGIINLERTNISNTYSGFAEGNVSGTLNGRTYTGIWGSQFYGNNSPDGKPEHVGGTMAAKSGDFLIYSGWTADKDN